jgi:fructose-1,6-bisphosphatase I/sedoheptulose-1,7-bisphosphatase
MPLRNRQTLTQFLIAERQRFPQASGEFNALILNIAIVCKCIARQVQQGALAGLHGDYSSATATTATNVHGEVQKKLDVLSNDLFIQINQGSGYLAGFASEEMDVPLPVPPAYPRGKYLLIFDPLDGSSNIDVNVCVGSIFSILRAPERSIEPGAPISPEDCLQPGRKQLAAGYAIYGPSTMFVLTVGRGTHGFTLEPSIGEFVLTHPDIRVPHSTHEFAINASNSRFWEPPVKRYVTECLAGKTGPRAKDFNMRWIASLVAEAHRILMRGGVFLYPRDLREPKKPGRLRLLYEANPISFLIEQAGGRASTGTESMLDTLPQSLHQRIGFVFGSQEEVQTIERYHHEPAPSDDQPLFAERGLFQP